MKLKSILGVFLGIFLSTYPKVDFVVYSYDRPMQLFALLESMQRYILDETGEIQVIYRVSNYDYSSAYEVVKMYFSKVKFYKQGAKPQLDFKPLAMKCAFESPNDYVSFVVDDIIVKDFFKLSTCIKYLEKTGAYCFLLRIGKNIKRCYPMKINSPVPESFKKVEADIYTWDFEDGLGDWGYPNNNDMTIYRKKDIEKDLREIEDVYFTNTFYEPYWCSKINKKNLKGLSFEYSKIVNLCLNIVNLEQPSHHQFSSNWKNESISKYSSKNLLDQFNKGFKFNIDSVYKIYNEGAHIEFNMDLIKI